MCCRILLEAEGSMDGREGQEEKQGHPSQGRVVRPWWQQSPRGGRIQHKHCRKIE